MKLYLDVAFLISQEKHSESTSKELSVLLTDNKIVNSITDGAVKLLHNPVALIKIKSENEWFRI